jgi:predicted MPP superfamily phosphohydrolase
MFLLAPLPFLVVLYAWATASFPWLAKRRRWVAGVLAGLWLIQLSAHFLSHSNHPSAFPRVIVELVLVPIVFAAMPISLLRLGSWIAGQIAARAAGRPPMKPSEGQGMSRRQAVEAAGGVALFGATGTMIGWGMVRGRHAFELTEVPIAIQGLPRVLDGYTIVQVSDIHAGDYVGERELDEGLSLVRGARPDLVVVTGDIVDFESERARLVARRLVDLAPRDGVAAVLGNHDYYADQDEVTAAVRAAGIDMLVDEGRVIRRADGGGFALLGVDDRWSIRYGRSGPRLAQARAMVPPDLARILLSHQPQTIEGWAGQVALQLSGHTHGGQINPGFRPANIFLKYVSGLYRVDGTALYVNRGFGTVATPARIGAPPEVTRFVLVAA